MKKLFLLVLVTVPSLSATLEVVRHDYNYQNAPEYQAILSHLKSLGEFSSKEKDSPVKKALSRGEQMVEEAKARNRAKLAEMYKQDKNASDPSMTELEKWKSEERETLNKWKKETEDQLNTWKREQEIFLGRIKIYKENTFKLPVKAEKIVEKEIPVEAVPDVHIVNRAFNVPMKDQANRPTCVAFAGIRAMEILLSQNKREEDLSEQYLYWAGKPKCQKSPCSEKGSWIKQAYLYSQVQTHIDVPVESKCIYAAKPVEQNETQIPLVPTCMEGSVKVTSFMEAKTIADVVENIKKDVSVIIAAKLSENFYRNKGLITLADSEKKNGELDSHSLGHAFLAVGVMELPQKLKSTEGDFCIVIANSWGKGWGAGGYSCITQKWFEKFRQPSPFIALTKLEVK